MKSKRSLYLSVAVLLLILSAGRIRAARYLQRDYVMEKVLPSGFIAAITAEGRYVWFGGYALRPGEETGLSRFDLETDRWKLYLEPEGVRAEEINALAVMGKKVWIGSDSKWPWNRGVHVFDPSTRSSERFTVEDDGLPHWRVRDMDSNPHEVWVATVQGVGQYHKNAGAWRTFTREKGHLSTDLTISIHIDTLDDYVWVGSFNGLERYDRRRRSWESFHQNNSIIPSGVIDIAAGPEAVWLVAPPEVIKYDRNARRFERWEPYRHIAPTGGQTGSIAVHGDDLFLGRTNGLHAYDLRSERWTVHNRENGLEYESIQALAACDRYVWCTDKLGRAVSRFDRRNERWESFQYRRGAPSNHIYSLLSDNHHLYVGTLGNGIWKYDIRRDRWVNLNIFLISEGQTFQYAGDDTPTMYSDIRDMVLHQGRLWMATNQGLCMYDPQRDKPGFEIISQERFPMRSIAVVGDKLLCGGQRHGLRIYDTAAQQWRDISPQTGLNRQVVDIHVASNDAVWITDGNRVYEFNTGEETALPLETTPQEGITSLLADGKQLWIGTDFGLWTHDIEAGTSTEVPWEHLPSEYVLSLHRHRGRIWIATDEGLASCAPDLSNWRYLTADDYLSHNSISTVEWDDDYMWVGTLGGGMTRLTEMAAE